MMTVCFFTVSHKGSISQQCSCSFAPDQDETFFYIAGYTSGGAPYGVTWEEMGISVCDELEENASLEMLPDELEDDYFK